MPSVVLRLAEFERQYLGRFVVFAASFCLLLVEIVGGRVMAPYLGVSIFTWTAIIGTVLLAIAAGNYVGGVLADRRLSRAVLGVCLAAAGAAVLVTNFLVPILGKSLGMPGLALWERVFLFSLPMLFPPAFLLSLVTPQVARMELRDLSGAGRLVGSLGAWGALGSILGTYVSGFLLISLLGTKPLLAFCAAFLMALGAWVARGSGIWRHRLSGVIVLFFVGDFFLPGMCKMETNYYCIRVSEERSGAATQYILRLDHLIHSYVNANNPDDLGYGYEQVYSHLIAYRFGAPDRFSSFFIGGGGYVLPRYLERFFPQAESVVAEIDPGVTEANHRYMQLPRETRVRTSNLDARMYLQREEREKKFDLVFGDAFNDFSVPYHLTTVEFHRLLKGRMQPDGLYALNLIDDARYGNFLASMTRTLGSVWQHVYLAPLGPEIKTGRNTFVLLASDAPIDLDRWNRATALHAPDTIVDEAVARETSRLLPDADLEKFLAGHPAPVLTDDFVPTDHQLAPVFIDAYY